MATELGKFPYELEQLPVDEYDRLATWFAWRHDQEKPKHKQGSNPLDFMAEIKNRTNNNKPVSTD